MDHECDGKCADIITEPGKFEGEPVWLRDYIWPLMLDGMSDATTGNEESTVDWFRAPFECDAIRSLAGICVWEATDGFAYKQTFDSAEQFDLQLGQSEDQAVEDAGPQDDDLTCSNERDWFMSGKLVLTIGEDEDRDQKLAEYMASINYWPNCWTISDHGNALLLTIPQ